MKQNQTKQLWNRTKQKIGKKGSKKKHKEHINTETHRFANTRLHGNIKPGTIIYTQRTDNIK